MGDNIYGATTPVTANTNDGTRYTLGTNFQVSTGTNLLKIRWYAPSSSPGAALLPIKWQLWNVDTSSLVTNGTFGTLTLGAWNEVSPGVALTAGVNYCVSIVTDQYTATTHYFDSSITHGIITAPVAAGKFFDIGNSSTTAVLPTGSFNNGGYFVDAEVGTSGTTPFTRDYASTWRVLNGVTRDYASTWRVTNTLTADYASTWRVLNAFAARDFASTWRVLNTFTADYASTWRVLNAFTARDFASTWRVLNALTRDYADTWRVTNAFARDYADTWVVLSGTAFNRDYASTWRVFNVLSADYVSSWRVLGTFARDYASQWRVLGFFTRDYASTWRVFRSFTRDYASSWVVIADTPAGLTVQVWSGGLLVSASLFVWSGGVLIPATVESIV